VQIGYAQGTDGLSENVDDPEFATAVGLIRHALEIHTPIISRKHKITEFLMGFLKRIFRNFSPY